MNCPRGGTRETFNLVETYLACSTTCQHCNLLLRATETYKPGWIDQKTGEGGKREIEAYCYGTDEPTIINLFEATAENARVEVGSFRLLRKPKGMPFHNIIIMLRAASSSLPFR
jgi:hypothetical protein